MADLKESDFFYGAVISTLLNNKICPALIEGGKDRQVYDFTTNEKDFRLFVKYRSAPNTENNDYSSWQFNFSKNDIEELQQYIKLNKELSVELICGKSLLSKCQYAVLHKDEINVIFGKGKSSVTVSLKSREHNFRISIGGGRGNALQVPRKRLY